MQWAGGCVQRIWTIYKRFPNKIGLLNSNKKYLKKSEQFVLSEQMHAHNIGRCNIGVRFKTLDIVRLCPKITRLYHTWFISVKKAKYILLYYTNLVRNIHTVISLIVISILRASDLNKDCIIFEIWRVL